MLYSTSHLVPEELFEQALANLPQGGFKQTINQPTGDFFYDPWEIKPEFKGTVWEQLLDTLPFDKGEARLITLESGQCYYSWHLSLTGNQSFLLDLTNQQMFKLEQDRTWYDMLAGRIHSAANFGQIPRVQLVVRQLLWDNELANPVHVRIEQATDKYDYRYLFDNHISPWLNAANRDGHINKFKFTGSEVSFDVEQSHLTELESLVPEYFRIVK
jgi:hypothetical protein